MAATSPADAEKAEFFLNGLGKILIDLNQASRRDPEAMMLIGSLADRLCTDAGRPSWTEVKNGLDETERHSLIGTFSRQIAESSAKGQIKIAYALQALASSLVGAGFADSRIRIGVNLLDEAIDAACRFYRNNSAPSKPN